MEGQFPPVNSQYQYQPAQQSAQWSRLVRRNTLADSVPNLAPNLAIPSGLSTQLDLLPILLPTTPSNFHRAQPILYNNNPIVSNRLPQLQSSPLPPLLSAQHIQAVPGSRSISSGGITARYKKSALRGGHGSKEQHTYNTGERVLITEEKAATMPPKKMESSSHQLPARPHPQHQNSILSQQSSSVPSTPQQHARKFSFESREPSPNAEHNHSPRSAYSESNITLPSRKPTFPQGIGCRFETAQSMSKRRIPYSVGGEKLDKLKPSDIKSRLSKDEEAKLSADSQKLYAYLLPTEESEKKRERLVQKLETLFNTEWPGHNIRVHMFGSSGNLLCTDKSDVDICITTDPWPEMKRICPIAELLAKNGMQKVICVSTAKVPIVKIWDPELELACDMNLNNPLALENTRMIKTYVQIDDRVRPLAMIVKHWTKQRIVNDAGFGSTLSSYTWICMIINFLQSRSPPILPALHQRPHMILPPKDGSEPSTFADDLNALRGFGDNNTETLSQLLFQFFRFYAHEFDYEKLVISVRSGKQISKVEKKWHYTNNNRLCVEEPFNVGRNLGNTADDISFRGLHLELRRAFELISQAKLDECCEEYEFPKEVERRTQFEPQKPRAVPVLPSKPELPPNSNGLHNNHHLNSPRSVSQHSNRGGKHNRGGRNGNGSKSANNNRRASSGTFDGNHFYGNLPQNAQNAWIQSQAQSQLHNDLFATYTVLQAQENNLRLQLYAQGLQNQTYGQTHGNGGQTKQQATDRNRTNSFDQGPLSAPLGRSGEQMFYFPVGYQQSQIYGYQTPSTNPSSPSLSNAVPDLRRSMHRGSVANGGPGPTSNSTLRSHSQPAARSGPSPLSTQGPGVLNPGLGIYPYRQPNGVIIPSFIADENIEPNFESASSHATTASAEDTASKEYVGYYVNPHAPSPMRRQSAMHMSIPAFGDIGQPTRRLSTERLPQSVLDIMKRPSSRSPSPLGHDRSFSAGFHSAPLTAVPSQQGISSSNLRALNSQGPLVVNGSNPVPVSIPSWRASITEDFPPEVPSLDTAFGSIDSASHPSATSSDRESLGDQDLSGLRTPTDNRPEAQMVPPMVVNGSTPLVNGSASINPTRPTEVSTYAHTVSNGFVAHEQTNGTARLSPNSRNRLARQMNGGMSPLDIGQAQFDTSRDELRNLSPVYETRTPSPTANRKFEPPSDKKSVGNVSKNKEKIEPSKASQKLNGANGNANGVKSNLAPPKASLHIRNAKSEGSGPGSWQPVTKGKKKGPSNDKLSGNGKQESEKFPRNENERKGG